MILRINEKEGIIDAWKKIKLFYIDCIFWNGYVIIEKKLNFNVKEKSLWYLNILFKSSFFFVLDDYRLLTFLRGCKFSLEKCKKKLDMYFTMRTAIPEFFTNRDVTLPELKEITKIM